MHKCHRCWFFRMHFKCTLERQSTCIISLFFAEANAINLNQMDFRELNQSERDTYTLFSLTVFKCTQPFGPDYLESFKNNIRNFSCFRTEMHTHTCTRRYGGIIPGRFYTSPGFYRCKKLRPISGQRWIQYCIKLDDFSEGLSKPQANTLFDSYKLLLFDFLHQGQSFSQKGLLFYIISKVSAPNMVTYK